ncbi:MAG: PH domain-containing protein [Alphaproteobacteria bacterium]
MAYIKKVIGPDEQQIGITTVHWIYGAQGLAWLASLMLFGASIKLGLDWGFGLSDNESPAVTALYIISAYIFWICTLLGVVLFILYFVMMISTEIGLTSKRVIYKRGWIFIAVKQIDLEEIKAADVDSGIFGRFLNYGYVSFDARFVQNMILPALADPHRFVKALNEARTMIKQNGGSMTVMLDGNKKPGELKIKEEKPGKKRRPKKQKAKVEPPPEPPAHDLNEERYSTMETDQPAGHLQEFARETVEAIANIPNTTIHDSKTSEPPKQGQPAPKPGPLVFLRDPKQRKEELRRRLKSAFSYKTRRKAP